MPMIADPRQVVCTAERVTTYRVLASLLARELIAQDVRAMSAPAGYAGKGETSEATDGLDSALTQLLTARPAEGDEEALLDLAAEYARLFLGVGGPPAASPYEGFYHGESLLYGQTSTEVRALLDRWNVAHPSILGPEDHVAVELLLMAALADRSLVADAAESVYLVEYQIEFLEQRLLRWIPAFAEQVRAQTRSAFYGRLVDVVDRFLRGDIEYLRAAGADERSQST